MQNLPNTTDAMNPAMIIMIRKSVNHDHHQKITQVLIIDQEKHQIIVKAKRKRSNSQSDVIKSQAFHNSNYKRNGYEPDFNQRSQSQSRNQYEQSSRQNRDSSRDYRNSDNYIRNNRRSEGDREPKSRNYENNLSQTKKRNYNRSSDRFDNRGYQRSNSRFDKRNNYQSSRRSRNQDSINRYSPSSNSYSGDINKDARCYIKLRRYHSKSRSYDDSVREVDQDLEITTKDNQEVLIEPRNQEYQVLKTMIHSQ